MGKTHSVNYSDLLRRRLESKSVEFFGFTPPCTPVLSYKVCVLPFINISLSRLTLWEPDPTTGLSRRWSAAVSSEQTRESRRDQQQHLTMFL